MSKEGEIKEYYVQEERIESKGWKTQGMKKDRTYAVLQEILLSRAPKTLTPGLAVNTKTHLMYFNVRIQNLYLEIIFSEMSPITKKQGKIVRL